jgi:hypothetical protein
MLCFVKVCCVGIVRREQEVKVKVKVARVLVAIESQSVLVFGETEDCLQAVS